MKHTSLLVATIMGLSLAALAGPTAAAERVSAPAAQSHEAQSDRIFREALACVVKQEPKRSRALLSTAPGSEDETKASFGFESLIEECATSVPGISFSLPLLRGGIAEIFYHEEFPGGLAATNPLEGSAAAWVEPRLDRGSDQASALTHAAARCLVASQSTLARRLLATEPLSDAEAQVVSEIQPFLGPCLSKGVKFTVNRQTLRALLAEAALEYGRAQRGGAG